MKMTTIIVLYNVLDYQIMITYNIDTTDTTAFAVL